MQRGRIELGGIPATPDHVNNLGRQALAQRLRLMGGPFNLAVELAGGGQNSEFAKATAEVGFAPQIVIERASVERQLWAMEVDAAGPAQAADRTAFRSARLS